MPSSSRYVPVTLDGGRVDVLDPHILRAECSALVVRKAKRHIDGPNPGVGCNLQVFPSALLTHPWNHLENMRLWRDYSPLTRTARPDLTPKDTQISARLEQVSNMITQKLKTLAEGEDHHSPYLYFFEERSCRPAFVA